MKYLVTFLTFILFTLSVSGEDIKFRLGVDYRIVDNPLPVKKDGVVEVTETFWYGCGACYNFDAPVNSWASKLDDDVKFTKMPVAWGSIHELHASLYYTIEALKLDPSVHSAVFVSMHKEGNFLSSEKSIKNFLQGFGVAPEVTEKYLNSFTVKQRVNRATKNARQLRVNSTPIMIVDGKYIIEPRGPYQRILNVVDYVVELQKPNS
tara:strand:- start:256 stop:876 length:621 start_codon:yes stop_codon:yes gene_type:complete